MNYNIYCKKLRLIVFCEIYSYIISRRTDVSQTVAGGQLASTNERRRTERNYLLDDDHFRFHFRILLIAAVFWTQPRTNEKWKKRSGRRKHCALAVVRRSQKFIPFPGAQDSHDYLHLRTQFGEDRCTQFRVIVVTNPQPYTQTHKHRLPGRPLQTGPITIHCAAKPSAQCNQNSKKKTVKTKKYKKVKNDFKNIKNT